MNPSTVFRRTAHSRATSLVLRTAACEKLMASRNRWKAPRSRTSPSV